MIKISASLLKSYLTCPRQAWYRLYAPELSVQTEPQVLGTITHSAIELFHDDKSNALKYAANLCAESGIDSYGLEKVFKFLGNFFDLKPNLPISRDLSFGIFEYKFEYKLKRLLVTGRFDFVSPDDGVVLDWKTSLSSPAVLSFDPQFIIYHLAFKNIFKKDPRVYYVSLSDKAIVEYKRSAELESYLLDKVIPKFLADLKNDHLIATGLYNYYSPCSQCSFRSPCYNTLFGGSSYGLPSKFS